MHEEGQTDGVPGSQGQGRDVTGSKYLPLWELATLSGPGNGHLASREGMPGRRLAAGQAAEGDPSDGAPGSKLQPTCGCVPGPAPLAESGDQVPRRHTKRRTGKPLTLYSADTPRSVSRSELQGNCPVTLYKFTEKLENKRTELYMLGRDYTWCTT